MTVSKTLVVLFVTVVFALFVWNARNTISKAILIGIIGAEIMLWWDPPWTIATIDTVYITWTVILATDFLELTLLFTGGISAALGNTQLVLVFTVAHALCDLWLPEDIAVTIGLWLVNWKVFAPNDAWLILVWAP